MMMSVVSIGTAEPVPAGETAPATALAPRRALLCARCSHPITTEDARVARGGAHVHTRINPHGYVFEIGCFAEAPGCRTSGDATTFFTWFPGHAWRIATCGSCGVHLGWRFDGDEGSFFGLLLDGLAGA